MRQLPTARGEGLTVSQLRAKLERKPRLAGQQIAAVVAALMLVAAFFVSGGLRWVAVGVGVSVLIWTSTR